MGEIHLDFLNFNTILLFLIILLIGGYLYYEIHTIKLTLNDLNLRLMQRNNISSDQEAIISPERSYSEMVHPEEVERNPDNHEMNDMWTERNDDSEIRPADDSEIRQQMTRDDSRSDDSRSDDSRSDDSRSDDSRSDDSRSDISQSEIEKDYGKTQFDNETNNASIDDILSDKVIITDDSLSDILNVDKDLSNIDEFMQSMKKNEPTKEYIDMTVSELKKILVEMNLPVSGNKTKLIERILENKK
tara:strand:+ start:3325 stop:4059 length:735 start_codon:yes stop_codon:yes gene_type:complete